MQIIHNTTFLPILFWLFILTLVHGLAYVFGPGSLVDRLVWAIIVIAFGGKYKHRFRCRGRYLYICKIADIRRGIRCKNANIYTRYPDGRMTNFGSSVFFVLWKKVNFISPPNLANKLEQSIRSQGGETIADTQFFWETRFYWQKLGPHIKTERERVKDWSWMLLLTNIKRRINPICFAQSRKPRTDSKSMRLHKDSNRMMANKGQQKDKFDDLSFWHPFAIRLCHLFDILVILARKDSSKDTELKVVSLWKTNNTRRVQTVVILHEGWFHRINVIDM